MIIINSSGKPEGKYSFVLPVGKKDKSGGIDPGDTVRIPVIKGGKVTFTTSKNGKEMVVKVGF